MGGLRARRGVYTSSRGAPDGRRQISSGETGDFSKPNMSRSGRVLAMWKRKELPIFNQIHSLLLC